jgi:hypothetical protein
LRIASKIECEKVGITSILQCVRVRHEYASMHLIELGIASILQWYQCGRLVIMHLVKLGIASIFVILLNISKNDDMTCERTGSPRAIDLRATVTNYTPLAYGENRGLLQ